MRDFNHENTDKSHTKNANEYSHDTIALYLLTYWHSENKWNSELARKIVEWNHSWIV